MNDSEDHGCEDHGDATLDAIALLEATIKGDDHALDVLYESVMASPHLGHIVGLLTGILASELRDCHGGPETALKYLAHLRGHELGSHGGGGNEDHEHGSPHADLDPADRIGFEVAEVAEHVSALASNTEDGLGSLTTVTEQNGDELARLANAVERLGDILDKRLS